MKPRPDIYIWSRERKNALPQITVSYGPADAVIVVRPEQDVCIHDFHITQTKSTCSQNGIKVCKCRLYGYGYTHSLPKLAHTFSDWVKVGVDEDGNTLLERTCEVCGAVEHGLSF